MFGLFRKIFFSLTFVLFLFGSLSNGEKLNERRILLPYNNGVPTNFTLEALSGLCYKWSSSRPDVASVKHLNNPSCSNKAVITVVSSVPKRQSTAIIAHDLKTNLQVRCDVEIDVIKRIMITTTTREIVYGELPETIKAIAFDDKNDMFTSIGGIQLDWTISPTDILRYRTWASSSYASPDFVEYWESRGAKSSYVLVEGVQTGSARIKARIMGSPYHDVEPAEVNVHVVANLMLIPSNDVFLVEGAKVVFRAEISKQGPRVPLDLPMEQYYLQVTDPTIAQFDEQSNQLEATKQGHTSLVLRDRNIDTNEDGLLSQTSTDIHVMRPSYISVQIDPGNSFQLRDDTVYTLTLSLYDDWHHRLYPSDNLNLTVEFPSKHFEILKSTTNGTYYVVRTIQTGSCKLKAQFIGAGNVILDTPLEMIQDITIYPPITLNPSKVFLPWLPKVKPTYTVHVDASGASGQYNWETTNDTLAQVKYSSSKSSRATIYTQNEGQVDISCTDVHNSLIFNSLMQIWVRPIEEIEILPSIVETQIGGSVILPIAVLGSLPNKEKFYFDDCAHVEFEVEIVEKNRIRYQQDAFIPGIGKSSCRTLSFECLASGNSRLRISIGSDTDKKIFTSAIVGCYKPLRLVHPEEFAVLSLGSIIDIAFEGGPKPWSMYPDGHYTKVTPSNESIVQINEIKDRYRYNKDLHVFRTRCMQYGESKIDLEVGNMVSPTLANPATTFTTVKIICAKPETLIIRPRMKSTCPQQEMVFTLEKNRDIELDVNVLDQQGNQFYNFSTLYFEWSKNGNGVFGETHGVREEVNGAKGYFSLTKSYQILKGLTTVHSRIWARITGYHRSYFGDRFDVRREIEIQLTDPLSPSEDNVSILKHSTHKKTITVEKGSGYFSIEPTSKDIVNVELTKTSGRQFNITPNKIGNDVITITDLCLNYPPVSLSYSVVEAIDIKVNIIDKIQLGSSVEGTFYVVDNRGIRIDSVSHSLLDLVIVTSNNFLTIGEIKPKNQFLSSFVVTADKMGLSTVIIQSQSDHVRSIQSQSSEIQIFSPLKIIPSNVTLIVGNYFQATFAGGPQTQRNVEFSIGDTSIATVNANGLIQAVKHGKTKLTGRVMNVNNFEYSRAEVELHVAPLKRIKIWSPINQLLVGGHIPLYIIGSSEQHETPFMFGQADPSLKITWTLSNEKIGTLESSFQKYGIIDSINDPIATRFVAKSVGTVSLKVTVEVLEAAKDSFTEQLYNNRVLVDTVQLQVYSDFHLSVSSALYDFAAVPIEQTFSSKVLLLSPQAELSLHFNNLDSVYCKLANASQVKIVNQTDNLVLKAGDQLESAILSIQRDIHKTGLMQHLSYAVNVEKVRYISLEFDNGKRGVHLASSTSSVSSLNVVPIGSEIVLSTHFYDNLGRKFDAVKSNLKWTLSRNDVITVFSGGSSLDSNSIRIRALKQGSVVMHIVDQVNQVGQYFKINTGSVIEPRNDPIVAHVSDIICLQCKLATTTSRQIDGTKHSESRASSFGVWSLENSNNQKTVGYIGPNSGTFVALSVGRSLLVFNQSVSGLSTYTNLVVKRLESLQLDTSSVVGITTTSPISIPVNTGSHISSATSLFTTCNTEHDIDAVIGHLRAQRLLPFICDVSFVNSQIASLWDIELQYNSQRAQWACVLTPKSGLDLENVSLFNLNVTITVMENFAATVSAPDVFDSLSSDSVYDPLENFHQITLPFLPAFQTSTKQIILTSDSKEIRFTVNSVEMVLSELLVKSSNEDILEVSKVDPQENSIKIEVFLRNADIFSNDVSNLHLLLISSITNQTEKIPVQIKLYGTLTQLPAQLMNQNFYNSATLLLATIMFCFVIYFATKRLLKPVECQVFSSGNDGGDFSSTFFRKTASPAFQSSPRRVIDYNNSSTANNGATPERGTSMQNLVQSPQLSTPLSSTSSPQSPRVGRRLYSTRQYSIQ